MSHAHVQPIARTRLLAFAGVTIVLGLLSRRYPLFGNYPGDALWATLVGILWAFVLPRARLLLIGGATLVTAFCVEFSQLYHAPWINEIRYTLLGRIVLGTGFDPIDLIAYTVGMLFALLILRFLKR